MTWLWDWWWWITKPDVRYAGRRLIDPSFEHRVDREVMRRILKRQEHCLEVLEGLMQPLVAAAGEDKQ